jgi:hypothetical protein
MKITIRESIAWAGSVDGETLQDVLAKITKAVPSVKFSIFDARPNHTGGWPIFDIEFDEDEIELMADYYEMEVQEFTDQYFG